MKPLHKVILFLIIILSFFLRFYQLGQNPPSLDWDEASLGYNAYSILKTGADEYGNKFPLAIRSFGDYKPPLYTYLTIPSVAVFGLNEFSVRFPSALVGVLTVVVGYFLMKELFPNKSAICYLLFTVFFAISPWHLQFSRVAFEANLGLFFFILGSLFFLKGLKKGNFFILSSVAFVGSCYSYHSPRLVAPLLLLGFALYFRRQLYEQRKWVIVSVLSGFLLILPLFRLFIGEGKSRFTSVTVLTPQALDRSISQLQEDLKRGDPLGKIIHNRRVVYFLTSLGGYLDHWNLNFLFLEGDAPARHHPVDFGMLYLWDLPFVLLGMYLLIRNKEKGAFLIFWWFLVAPAASSITTGTPHSVRALLYLPTFQIFASYGLWRALLTIKEKWGTKKEVLSTIVIFFFLFFNFAYYLDLYYIQTPYEKSADWQYGYKKLVEEVSALENQYKKIIITYKYDQPYIFFLFYQKTDPIWYQKQAPQKDIERFHRSFGKYEFINIDNIGRFSNQKGVLIAGTPEEIPKGTPNILKEIQFINGEVAFRIVEM